MQLRQWRQLPRATTCPVAVLLCQTTPWCYLRGLPTPEEGSRGVDWYSLPLLLPAGDVPHFPETAKLLFFPPAATRGKRKGKSCSSWGSGQARVKGCKQREVTYLPGFLFGHNLPLGWSHHPIAVGHKTPGDRLQSPSANRTTSAWVQGGQGISVGGERLSWFDFHNLTWPLMPWAFLSSLGTLRMLHLPHHSFGLPEFIFLRHKIEFCLWADFGMGLSKSHQVKKTTFFFLFF